MTSPQKSGLVNLTVVRFEVLMASVKIMVLWDVTPCNLVGRYQYFGGMCCLHHHGTRVFYPEDGGRKVL
jgi:hypothetical protein